MPDAGEKQPCLFCEAPALRPWFNKTAQGRDYPVCRCRDCSSAMVWPRPSQKDMDNYYLAGDYGPGSLEQFLALDVGHYPDSRQDAKRIVGKLLSYAPGKRFMDIGAGVGFFSAEALARGCEVTALEPNPNSAAAFESQLGFSPMQKVLDVEMAAQFAGSHDAILLSQVLEHICDVDEMLRALTNILVPSGVAAIAVPHFGSMLSRLQGKQDMYISPPEHVNYFSIEGLNALFQRHGFEVIKVHTVSKIPKEKIIRRLPSLLGSVAWRSVYAALKSAEIIGRGMIINAYYRKR